jgi:peptidyl-prolyl cis-trans isomerase A (cyclophilin A)
LTRFSELDKHRAMAKRNCRIVRGSRTALSLPLVALLASVAALSACDKGKVPEPEHKPASTSKPAATGGAAGAATEKKAAKPREPLREPEFRKISAKPVATVAPAPDDPLKGKFGIDDALKGLPGSGKQLFADIETSAGKLECELWPDKAPLTVANFVGLARGIRPWKQDGKWVKKPLYDGLVFHRVVKGFMIQGGDPNKDGSGGPGYEIPDEIWEDAHHDKRGLLAMANRGPNTNGSQFFIMDGPAPHLDGNYTIFGKCSPDDVIEKLSSTPTVGDRATDPPEIKKVVVRRAG